MIRSRVCDENLSCMNDESREIFIIKNVLFYEKKSFFIKFNATFIPKKTKQKIKEKEIFIKNKMNFSFHFSFYCLIFF